MKLYSYVVRYDIGFAPNPFHGLCSVATCKPEIRGHAAVGDWVMGTGSAARQRRTHLVYGMQVEEIVTYDQYWADPRFVERRPDLRGSRKQAFGDNIYHRDPATGGWLQENSRHSHSDGSLNPDHVARDTKSDHVLLGRQFVYFGADGPEIPAELRTGPRDFLTNPRGHRVNFAPDHAAAIVDWLKSLGTGVLGRPADWPDLTEPATRLSDRWTSPSPAHQP